MSLKSVSKIKSSDLVALSGYISEFFQTTMETYPNMSYIDIDTICVNKWKEMDEKSKDYYRGQSKSMINIDGTFSNLNSVKIKNANDNISTTDKIFEYVIEAVRNLNDKSGSSIQSIIKYIKNKYNLSTKIIPEKVKNIFKGNSRDGNGTVLY